MSSGVEHYGREPVSDPWGITLDRDVTDVQMYRYEPPSPETVALIVAAFEDPASVGLPPCQDISHAGARRQKETTMYGFDQATKDDVEHHEPGRMLPVGAPVTPTDICTQVGCPHLGQPNNTHCGRCTLPHGVAAKPRGGALTLTCTVNAPEAGRRYTDTPRPVACGKPAVIAILAEQSVLHAGDVDEDILTAYPVCADHAPEEVHEARCSMDASEFLVLDLPITNDQEN